MGAANGTWVKGEPEGKVYEQMNLPVIASDFRECWDIKITSQPVTRRQKEAIKKEILTALVDSFIISPSDIKKVDVWRSIRHNPAVSETEGSSEESADDSTSPPLSSDSSDCLDTPNTMSSDGNESERVRCLTPSPSEPPTEEEASTIPTPPPFSEPDMTADDVLNMFDL